ncbi:hypothetical protein PR202_gb26774 [Eleusine coracana subsp. coracana]|uniref:Josephin-like protein n=1 Tax=Eleusine coracana subsp. coracana TaxID=191504 RepID=A0AAV5FTC0_ELECO|nr:hypothetical protein QOZ80_1BG0054620 [Eleusine coracana subsp. coracana]GJN37785.1 hypothetical protein PR202_gb26774 [Eleusine coracana subsp. coracana]
MRAVKAATAACMPRLVCGGGGCRASTARPAASVSLLERIRDVVLRLIMLSAVSRSASVQRTTSSGRTKAKASSPRAGRHRRDSVTCRRDDSIRKEAVEDCIEFLKRSSAEGDAAKLSMSATATDAVVGKASSMAGANAKLSDTGGEDEEAAVFFVVNVGAGGDETLHAERMM